MNSWYAARTPSRSHHAPRARRCRRTRGSRRATGRRTRPDRAVRSDARVRSSRCAGATQTPDAHAPKPSAPSCVRRTCRFARSDSGTENTASSQPSASRGSVGAKMRASPSARIAAADRSGRNRPRRRGATATSRPRRFSRDMAERTAASSTSSSASSRTSKETGSQPSPPGAAELGGAGVIWQVGGSDGAAVAARPPLA